MLLRLALAGSTVCLAQPQQIEPVKATPASGIDRVAGTEASSGIQYVRLILSGTVVGARTAAGPEASSPPKLIAQCTLRPNQRYLFEVFTSFGGNPDLTFYPPWKSSGPGDLFPPRTEKTSITMEFFGYTHVKPIKRQFEIPVQTPGLYRYNTPSASSSNMEDITYYLRFLLALPTLHLTLNGQTVEFLTVPWINQIRKEPLCVSSGLK